MNKLTSFFTLVIALVAATMAISFAETARSGEIPSLGNLSEKVWSSETTAREPAAPVQQTPAPASRVVPGGNAQAWQQPRYWPVPQRGYRQAPPGYPPGGQYPAYPAAPAMAPAARVNPLSAELKQIQDQLTAKSLELEEARSMLEQLRGDLQDSLAAEEALSDKIAYSTHEQNALRMRVTELVKTLNTANVTMEQQHQLINNHQASNRNLTAERDRLKSELASRNEQLAALQAELQAATQALAQARTSASTAAEALSAAMMQIGTHMDELTRLEAKLQQLEIRLQSDWKSIK